MKNILKSYLVAVAIVAGLAAQPTLAQTDGATTSPTKVYATVGGNYSFTTTFTTEGFSNTDLLISYTANTSSPSLVPFPNCIDASTQAPYDGGQPNTKYVLWDASPNLFPQLTAPCTGGQVNTPITLGTFSGTVASFPAGGSFVVQVWNNNGAGAPNLTGNDVTVCQKVTVASVTAPSDAFEGTAQTFTVNFNAVPLGCGGFAIPVTLSGTATAAPDNVVVQTNNCTNIPDAATSCTVIVQGVDDNVADGTKVVTLTVTDSTAQSVYVSSGKSANGNVLDNEVSASVVATVGSINEAGPNGVITFSRGGSTASSLDLVSAITGTATYGTDYTLTAGTCVIVTQSAASITVTVPAAQSSCTINVVPTQDQAVEGSETVTFAPPTGANVTTSGSPATVTIADDDALPSINIVAGGNCAEGVPSVNCTFTVTATTHTTPPQVGAGPSVAFTLTGTATNNTDYKLVLGPEANCGNAAFTGPIATDFATPTVLTVCVVDDATVESGGETVIMTLTANAAQYTLTNASATRTIADDDSPQVITISASAATIPEVAGTTTYVLTRSGGSAGAQQSALTVNVTLSGSAGAGTSCGIGVDYTLTPVGPTTASLAAAPRTVTFAAASSTATVTIASCDDSVVDPNETATMTVGAPTNASDYTVGAPSAATVTIIDDEHGISVSVANGSVTEGQAAVFNLSCGGATGSVVVNYTITGADAGVSITPSANTITLNCPTGGTVTVPTIDDSNIGNARSITLTIDSIGQAPVGTVVGTPAAATVVVDDNDRPTVIPTLSELGLLTLLLSMAGVAGFALRRKI